MNDLVDAVAAAFAADGPLAAARQDHRDRPGQQAMARAVARALASGEHLAVEAGTGVGKTFAYLVPVLLSGQRALLSTATQALQDQLFSRDIPAVSRALCMPVRAALLKGRSSYLCLQRLEQARAAVPNAHHDAATAAGLERVRQWAQVTRSGDIGEMASLHERSALRDLVTSTRHNCVGADCPHAAPCHVNRARRQAQEADWVVINHHLFFADRLMHQTQAVDWLPDTGVVVMDEAHRLNDTAVELLANAISSDALNDLARELRAQGSAFARGLRPWGHLALVLEQACRSFTAQRRAVGAPVRHAWSSVAPEGVEGEGWQLAISGLDQALAGALEAVSATARASAELSRLLERLKDLQTTWGQLAPGAPLATGAADARWVEWGPQRSWRMVRAPRNCATHFGQLLQNGGQGGRSWIFASATLGHDDALSWFTRSLGLAGHEALHILRVPSPFDHAKQAALYVPHDLPDPADAAHTPALAARVARWASRLGGRTLVLTTTLRAVDRMAHALDGLLRTDGEVSLQVLAQGRLSRHALLERFRAAPQAGRGAILVASASFWEGVDLPGDGLQLLVIDKLPFPPPDDPLVAARVKSMEDEGFQAFSDVYLPEAAMALRQGAGRLIRSELDRGLLVIGDRRLLTRSYGNLLLNALPPMLRLVDEAELEAAIDGLVITRPSTRDRPCS